MPPGFQRFALGWKDEVKRERARAAESTWRRRGLGAEERGDERRGEEKRHAERREEPRENTHSSTQAPPLGPPPLLLLLLLGLHQRCCPPRPQLRRMTPGPRPHTCERDGSTPRSWAPACSALHARPVGIDGCGAALQPGNGDARWTVERPAAAGHRVAPGHGHGAVNRTEGATDGCGREAEEGRTTIVISYKCFESTRCRQSL